MSPPPATRDVSRLNSFVDGVMVVSMTLLVLDVRLPEGLAATDGRALIDALLSLWPKYFAYVVSFLVIAQYWLGYTDKFKNIKAADTTFAGLSILFLLVIGIVPFVTAVLAVNHGVVATTLYAGTMIVASLLLVIIWTYAVRRGFVASDFPPGQRWRDVGPWLQLAAVFALSIVIALFDAHYARISWLLLAVPVARTPARPV